MLMNSFMRTRNSLPGILKKIESLAFNPREGKALTGNHKGEFSLRVGAYRIVYELNTSGHIIFILTIKHRKHVY